MSSGPGDIDITNVKNGCEEPIKEDEASEDVCLSPPGSCQAFDDRLVQYQNNSRHDDETHGEPI